MHWYFTRESHFSWTVNPNWFVLFYFKLQVLNESFNFFLQNFTEEPRSLSKYRVWQNSVSPKSSVPQFGDTDFYKIHYFQIVQPECFATLFRAKIWYEYKIILKISSQHVEI